MRIVNGRVYIDGRFQENCEISIQGDAIAAIGASLPPEETYDARAAYVIPGFIDLHIHGFGGRDTMDGEAGVRTMSERLVEHGVTAFLPTTMTASIEDTRAALAGAAAVMEKPAEGAAVLGCHMEGPFFNAKRKGAQPEQYLLNPSLEAFERMTGPYAKIVRQIALAPELPDALPFIQEMIARGIRVSCGHTDATYKQMMDAVAMGAGEVTHLYNAMSPLSHREPGAVGAALACPQLLAEFIADLVHLHPAAIRAMYAAKGAAGCVAITDSMMAGGMPEGAYAIGGQDVLVQDGAVRLPDGTLAGSILTLRTSLENMVCTVGVPLEDALPMYTSTPADRLCEMRRGRLAAGSLADIVVLGQDFSVRAVWVSGKRRV